MPDIPKDAPLTDIYIRTPSGSRHRVYRGRTKAHIEWKLPEHRNRNPEVIEVLHDVSFLDGIDTDKADEEDDD